MQEIRYGILSTAQIVPRFVQGIREAAGCRVTAIASRTLAKAERAARELEIPIAYGSYQELFESGEVDIIYIATYNQGHYQAAKEALLNGKHVLLEKPFTLTSAEAEELFQLAETQQCFLMEAQKAVFLPITTQVKQLLETGKLGQVRWIDSVIAYPNVDHIRWFDSRAAGGGVMRGSGVYPVEYLQYLLGTGWQEAQGAALYQKGGTDKQANLLLQFADLTASLYLTTLLDLPNRLVIHGTNGKVEIPSFWKTRQAFVQIGAETYELIGADHSEFFYEVEHVNDCLRAGLLTSPIMTKEVTLRTVGLMDWFYREIVQDTKLDKQLSNTMEELQ